MTHTAYTITIDTKIVKVSPDNDGKYSFDCIKKAINARYISYELITTPNKEKMVVFFDDDIADETPENEFGTMMLRAMCVLCDNWCIFGDIFIGYADDIKFE